MDTIGQKVDKSGDVFTEVLKSQGRHTVDTKQGSYSIDLLPSEDAMGLLAWVGKLMLPAAAATADGVMNKPYIMPEDDFIFSTVAVSFVTRLDQIEVSVFVKQLLDNSNVRKDGVQVDPSMEFRGRLGDYAKVIEFILRQNCGDFFTGYLMEMLAEDSEIRTLISKVKKIIPSAPEDQE